MLAFFTFLSVHFVQGAKINLQISVTKAVLVKDNFLLSSVTWTYREVGKISLILPIVLNVPTRVSLVIETKGILFLWLGHLNNKEIFINGYLPYIMDS